jgi:hypothetical protein
VRHKKKLAWYVSGRVTLEVMISSMVNCTILAACPASNRFFRAKGEGLIPNPVLDSELAKVFDCIGLDRKLYQLTYIGGFFSRSTCLWLGYLDGKFVYSASKPRCIYYLSQV